MTADRGAQHERAIPRPLLALTAAAALAYAAWSIINHARFETSTFDLGIYDQAIWHYSRLEAPESTLAYDYVLPSVLGDHFSPIIALLAPLYWIAAEVELLLVAQAVLLASSAIPVFLFAARRLDRRAAYLVAVAYVSFWGIQYALEAELQPIAFAPLLIGLAILWADDARWWRCLAALGALLLVKEDLALLVAFFGLYLFAIGRRREAALALAGGVVAFLVIVGVVIPHFAGGLEFNHWTFTQLGEDLPDAVGNIATDPLLVPEVLFDDSTKVETMLYLALVPFLGIALLSPAVILAVPLVLERMLSTKEGLWTTGPTHHALLIAPVLAVGFAWGLAWLTGRLGDEGRRARVQIAVAALAVVVGLVATPRGHPLGNLLDPGFWSPPEDARAASRAVDVVPDQASVAAQGNAVPHLSRRSDVFQLQRGVPRTDWVVYDAGDERYTGVVARLRARADYRRVFEERGWTVLRRVGA